MFLELASALVEEWSNISVHGMICTVCSNSCWPNHILTATFETSEDALLQSDSKFTPSGPHSLILHQPLASLFCHPMRVMEGGLNDMVVDV